MTTLARTGAPGCRQHRLHRRMAVADRGRPPEIILDLSRLLSRALHNSPTGIDRVEMAYARHLPALAPGRLGYAAMHPTGVYGRLPRRAVTAFLDQTEERWETGGGAQSTAHRWITALSHGWTLRPRAVAPSGGPRVILQLSPHHLQHPDRVADKLGRERAAFVCMVHDIIPITHPEYGRPGGLERHWRRLRTIDRFADGILTNSQATLDALLSQAAVDFRDRPNRVARLGVDPRLYRPSPTETDGHYYFVCLSTIEPRKNHLLLLTIWRSLAEALGTAAVPILYLVGRRGWENENVLDLLDRCPALRTCVRELPRLPDMHLRPLLAGARAVLMPSFVEGFGMPVAEALAAGAPVLASDIPAHREAGGGAPDYIDPIDGAAWRDAILDYCASASIRRAAQKKRIAAWRPTTWEAHMQSALSLIDEVAAS